MSLQSQPRRRRAVAASNANANDDDDNGPDYYDDNDNDGAVYNNGDVDNNNGNANANAMGLAALLPAPMRGRPVAEDRAQGRGPYELDSPAELDNLMSTADNAVVYFYKPECPYCKQFAPVYADLAADVHRTNRGSPAASILGMAPVPIVMAKIDGARHREGINALRDGFLGPKYGRGYPTLLFKRGADKVGVTWDSSKPREREAIADLMANFYGDPTLAPMDPRAWPRPCATPTPSLSTLAATTLNWCRGSCAPSIRPTWISKTPSPRSGCSLPSTRRWRPAAPFTRPTAPIAPILPCPPSWSSGKAASAPTTTTMAAM